MPQVTYFKPAEIAARVAIVQVCSSFGPLALPCEGRAVDVVAAADGSPRPEIGGPG